MAMASRRSTATPLQHLGCGNADVHCLLRRFCVLGTANGECFVRAVSFCVPRMDGGAFISRARNPFAVSSKIREVGQLAWHVTFYTTQGLREAKRSVTRVYSVR
jgi:hypothetical protein